MLLVLPTSLLQVRDRDDLSLTGFTNKVHEFVMTIGLDKVPSGIHVLGHSLGGAIAGNYGAHFGKKDGVKLVTLVCPAMRTPQNRWGWLFDALVSSHIQLTFLYQRPLLVAILQIQSLDLLLTSLIPPSLK